MMKRFLASLGAAAVLMNTAAWAGQFSMTTYYPAPFGSYAQLRLVPAQETPESCRPGMMYVNDVGQLEFCADTPTGPQWTTISTRMERGSLLLAESGSFPVSFAIPFTDIPLIQLYYQVIEDTPSGEKPGPLTMYGAAPVTNITPNGFTVEHFLAHKKFKVTWVAVGH